MEVTEAQEEYTKTEDRTKELYVICKVFSPYRSLSTSPFTHIFILVKILI